MDTTLIAHITSPEYDTFKAYAADIIEAHGGTLTENGRTIAATFTNATVAVRAAQRLQVRFQHLLRGWVAQGFRAELSIGVGDAHTLATRATNGEILISNEVFEAAQVGGFVPTADHSAYVTAVRIERLLAVA